ncbi:hypothetical protein [Azospirillum largimobile]
MGSEWPLDAPFGRTAAIPDARGVRRTAGSSELLKIRR